MLTTMRDALRHLGGRAMPESRSMHVHLEGRVSPTPMANHRGREGTTTSRGIGQPDVLTASDAHTVCPWKGTASYYVVVVEGQGQRCAALVYPPAAQRGCSANIAPTTWRFGAA